MPGWRRKNGDGVAETPMGGRPGETRAYPSGDDAETRRGARSEPVARPRSCRPGADASPSPHSRLPDEGVADRFGSNTNSATSVDADQGPLMRTTTVASVVVQIADRTSGAVVVMATRTCREASVPMRSGTWYAVDRADADPVFPRPLRRRRRARHPDDRVRGSRRRSAAAPRPLFGAGPAGVHGRRRTAGAANNIQAAATIRRGGQGLRRDPAACRPPSALPSAPGKNRFRAEPAWKRDHDRPRRCRFNIHGAALHVHRPHPSPVGEALPIKTQPRSLKPYDYCPLSDPTAPDDSEAEQERPWPMTNARRAEPECTNNPASGSAAGTRRDREIIRAEIRRIEVEASRPAEPGRPLANRADPRRRLGVRALAARTADCVTGVADGRGHSCSANARQSTAWPGLDIVPTISLLLVYVVRNYV